jgi:uncharacterized phage-associated protein
LLSREIYAEIRIVAEGKAASFLLPRGVEFTFNFDKFLACVQYMATRTSEVTDLDTYKIVKLLFLSDKYHLVRFARPITGDLYYAMEYGPVGTNSFDLVKMFVAFKRDQLGEQQPDARVEQMARGLDLDLRFLYPRFSTKASPEFSYLSKSDLMALDHVIERFGRFSFNELKSITHSVYAYRKTWHESRNGPMAFEDFFEEDSDAIEGARELMVENARTAEAFPSIEEL